MDPVGGWGDEGKPMHKRDKGIEWVKVAADVKATESVCWICGGWIDKKLPAKHPASFSVDHVVPLFLNGHPTARGNLRAAHFGCNVTRGNRMRGEARRARSLRTSRRW